MRFKTLDGVVFEIPDEWWAFAEMDRFRRDSLRAFPPKLTEGVELVDISQIRAPQRDFGVEPFKKCKLVPILCALRVQNPLPPIEVTDDETPGHYRVHDGFHRYYVSVAVGFPQLPIINIHRGNDR